MAFDGITAAGVVAQLRETILDGRIDKIYQPWTDEIILAIRARGANWRLLLTANATYPRAHFTNISKENPLAAPMFCMVLRKHLTGGRLVDISQPDFERVIRFGIEARNEMGDAVTKTVIIEIMGKHSNIILVDENEIVLDSIKHVSFGTSSVRQILPGRDYLPPPSQSKVNPINWQAVDGLPASFTEGMAAQKAIYQGFTGISPGMAGVIADMAGLDADNPAPSLDAHEQKSLISALEQVFGDIKTGKFAPQILANQAGDPVKFYPMFWGTVPPDMEMQKFDNISNMLETFYSRKDNLERSRQKSQDLRRLIGNLIERCVKKADLQQRLLEDIAEREQLRLFGELCTANIHAIPKGAEKFAAANYYEDGAVVEIPLVANKTAAENAQIFFKKYAKQKRAYDALQGQISANEEDLAYLETMALACEHSENAADLEQIRAELSAQGFVKARKSAAKTPKKPAPMRFTSSDGYEIFVGKNNAQNDEITMRMAQGADIWLHTKNIPGSHVIIKARDGAVSDVALNEAANLAAYFSRARGGSLVPVDYCPKKFVKKPSGAKPGMVIYDNYKTAYITPDENAVKNMTL